ncbi:MAG: hypothetical protein ABR552_02290 [Actinomycetota bacterium]
MRYIRYILAAAAVASLWTGGKAAPIYSEGQTVCAGAPVGTSGHCSVATLTVAAGTKSTDASYVSCAQTTGSCFTSYQDTRNSNANGAWGPSATNALVPQMTVGPVVTPGIYASNPSATSDRVWAGMAAGDFAGSLSVAAGRNPAGHPFVCIVGFGRDGTPGHVIAAALHTIGANPDNVNQSDAQVCSAFLEGF